MSIRTKLAVLLLLVTLTTLGVAMGLALWHSSAQAAGIGAGMTASRDEATGGGEDGGGVCFLEDLYH